MFCTPLRHFEPSYYGASEPYYPYAYARAPPRQSCQHHSDAFLPSPSYAPPYTSRAQAVEQARARAVEQARAREAAIAAQAAEREAAAYHELLAHRREQARREAARQEYLREVQRGSNYDEDFLARLFGHDKRRAPRRDVSGRSGRHDQAQAMEQASTQTSVHPVETLSGPSVTAEASTSAQGSSESHSVDKGPAKPTISYEDAVAIVHKFAKQAVLIRQRLRALGKVRTAFEVQRGHFTLPASLDFDDPKSQEREQPILAYTPNNRPLQAYEESLLRLLTDLDDVPSSGLEKVKSTRKALAKDIQTELNRVDSYKTELWKGKTDEAQDKVSSSS